MDQSTQTLRKFVLGKIIDQTDKEATEKYQIRYVPKGITTNSGNVDRDHFAKFQNKFLSKKKNLELNVLRDNK